MTSSAASAAPEPIVHVRHATYGIGVVTGIERGGLVLRVRFDRFPALEVSLPARLLRRLDAESGTMRLLARTPKAPARPRTLDDLQILEALRLGVVPLRGLLAYTVGRDHELEIFRRLLDPAHPDRALAVLGDYGTGKTHLLELMQHIALQEGWVVGRAWLDPQEAPPSKPRRVYAALVRSLVYPDQLEAGESGLWPLLEKAAARPELRDGLHDEAQASHVFLTPAIRYAGGLIEALETKGGLELEELQLLLVDWIEGRATRISQWLQHLLHEALPVRDRLLALSDFGTLPRVYGYLISGVAALCRAVGYRGLLLLLDETELFSNLDLEARARAVDVFKVLIGAALPEGGGVDLSAVRVGGHGIIRRLPPRFSAEPGLALALAATPGSRSEDFLRATLGEPRVLELGAFSARDFHTMSDRILGLYLNAHTETSRRALAALEGRVHQWLARGQLKNPREFARRVVDFLDQCRHTMVEFSG